MSTQPPALGTRKYRPPVQHFFLRLEMLVGALCKAMFGLHLIRNGKSSKALEQESGKIKCVF